MGVFAASAHANLLANGSFETGDFTGWTLAGNLGYTGVGFEPGFAEDGSYDVIAGPVGSDGYASQTFSDTAGDTLSVSGWVFGYGDEVSDFDMTVDGTGLDLNPVQTDGVWTEYSFDATATGSDTFSVGFRDDPSYIYLDNFSVTESASSTPGPVAIAPFALGLFGVIRRRRSA
jgi:MYXO-CTERM domain-containing protein